MAKKILIIENDPTAMRLSEYTLKQRGYQVLTTCNGLEGIITAQKEAPDLIILDVMLPGVDGFEVCRRLRAGAQTAEIPILIISGKAQQDDIATGFRVGASDYLPKPATPSDIVSRVESLLAEKPAGQARVIAFTGSNEHLGMTMILANLAAAISELGKQVTLVDVDTGQRSANRAPLSPPRPGVILETASISNEKMEPAVEVLPSGVRVLHIKDAAASERSDAGSTDLLHKLGGVTDYLLVDLPFSPTPLARSTFPKCDLIIIASDYRIDDLSRARDNVALLRFLGIAPERIAALLIDPEGAFPSTSLGSVRPYIEANLGIALAGVISLDVRMYQLSYLESQPITQSSPGSQLALDIKRMAQYIVTHHDTRTETRRSGIETTHLEKS